MKVLLVVDLEEKYLTEDDYMLLLYPEYWEEVRSELKEKYQEIISLIKLKKEEGWQIHFTGEEKPYETLEPLVDEHLPYWEDNKELIVAYYPPEAEVVLAGLFYERCVFAVSQLIKQSTVDKSLCISHSIVGDTEGYCYDGYDFSLFPVEE